MNGAEYKKYNLVKNACFLTCASTAITANLPPLLFLTFRESYGISYSLLGALILINFGTQLLFDLVYSFFSDKFNLTASVRATPAFMTAGLVLFSFSPWIFRGHEFIGLALSTVIFSAGGGLAEVLISPTVAAVPSREPDKLMSRLHSCYAWGVVALVLFTTGFNALFGRKMWQLLTLLLAGFPFASFIMMLRAGFPPLRPDVDRENCGRLPIKNALFYIICIFLGGASECTMSQWCSTYLESAVGVPKAVGDAVGVVLFGAALGLGRTLYAKHGRNINRVLFCGSAGAFFCYVTAVLTRSPAAGLAACALTGFFVSMLWPGSLIAVSEKIPHGGVALYALMAMGGDLGASVCPQAVGFITDKMLMSGNISSLCDTLSLSPETLAMKFGMAFAVPFPLILSVMTGYLLLKKKKKNV